MKYKTLLVTLLSAVLITAGCDKEKSAIDQSTSAQLAGAKAETKAVAQDMKDYTYAQKAEFVKEMQSELDVLNKDLDALSVKIEASSDAAKAAAKPKLQALRDQVAQLSKQLDDVKGASESTWDSVKAGCKKAYASVAEGFKESRQWLSEKIAP